MKSEPWKAARSISCVLNLGKLCGHTGNHIAGIHSILVLDESEAIHELDLGDLSSAMGVEMRLDVCLGSYQMVSRSPFNLRTVLSSI